MVTGPAEEKWRLTLFLSLRVIPWVLSLDYPCLMLLGRIQVIPTNSTRPRVVVPTNAGPQALSHQHVVACPLVLYIRTDKELQIVQVLKYVTRKCQMYS